ncbi:MAG: glycerophosphodiester phosphodiesterase family protein [Litorivicinaceae bacterium]
MEFIAHRGSADRVPENSFAGIHFTASNQITQIECDVSVASDGTAVIFQINIKSRMNCVYGFKFRLNHLY